MSFRGELGDGRPRKHAGRHVYFTWVEKRDVRGLARDVKEQTIDQSTLEGLLKMSKNSKA